jgi:hypothetical protein
MASQWEEKMEQRWGRVFVHESGHALMAILQGISCHGICYEKADDAGKFCALIPPSQSGECCRRNYLVYAAGIAAELLVYRNYDREAAAADLRNFRPERSPTTAEAIDEARQVLSGKKRQLRRLVSMLKKRAREVDFDLGRLPEGRMGTSDKRYLILLDQDKLKGAVRRP